VRVRSMRVRCFYLFIVSFITLLAWTFRVCICISMVYASLVAKHTARRKSDMAPVVPRC